MSLDNHPDIDVHNRLVEALRAGKLDDEFVRANLGPDWVGNDGAAAYVNWDCTLALLLPRPAMEWFAGVSKTRSRHCILTLEFTNRDNSCCFPHRWQFSLSRKYYWRSWVQWFQVAHRQMIGPDHIRDTRSYGTYWSVDRSLLKRLLRTRTEEEFFFYVEQTKDYLYAEVYSRNKIVAVVSLHLFSPL